MSVIQVGLVDTTGDIDPQLVQAAAAALNIQVTRDLPQFWDVQATVQYLPNHHKVPSGVWPVQLVRSLPPGEGGFHMDKHNQPYAKVIATPSDDTWTIDASHETLEMLVDPSGNRLQSSVAIEISGNGVTDTTGQFNYLVEACDPCEANGFGYSINGVLVSDFITPHFYDPMTTSGTRYSFTGAIKAPRQLLQGGYISFVNQELDEWQQILWVDPGPPQLNNLGSAAGGSLRVWIDGVMSKNKERHARMHAAIHGFSDEVKQHAKERRAKLDRIAELRARNLYSVASERPKAAE
jgi:hypothetical protein